MLLTDARKRTELQLGHWLLLDLDRALSSSIMSRVEAAWVSEANATSKRRCSDHNRPLQGTWSLR